MLGVVAMSTTLASAALSPTAGANLSAADFPTIQAAIDALPASGGRVFIPAGTYVLKGSVKPRDNVTLSGAGPATVLKAYDLVVSKTTVPIKVGDRQATVEDAKDFEVGMDVFAHKSIEWGPAAEKAFSYAITGIDGRILKFDRPATCAQPAGAVICTGAPVVLVFKKRNVVIENLTIDGNRKPKWVYVNLKMAGVYLWAASDCTVRNCRIVNASGDGTSAQFPPTGWTGVTSARPQGWAKGREHEGNGTQILGNHIRGASGFGIHLGGGQTKSIVKGNVVRACAWDGFYWCWDNMFSIVTDNIFTNNGWNGIGGYGDGSARNSDTQNITSNNICAYNGHSGIAVTGGSGNILSGNVCYANSRERKGARPGIRIAIADYWAKQKKGEPKRPSRTYAVHMIVTGNSCNDSGDGAMQKCGIEIAPNVTGVILRDNLSTGNLVPDATGRR
jgi:parallel beta-helix repeat protein